MAKRRKGSASRFAEANGADYVTDTWLENAGANLDLTPYEDVIQEGVNFAFEPEPAYYRSVEAFEQEVVRRFSEIDGEDGFGGIPIEYLLPIMREVDRRVEERLKSQET